MVDGSTPKNPRGITPTIANALPLRSMVCCKTSARPPKLRRQNGSLRMAAVVAGVSSSGVKVRPIAARTPSVSK
jgi:hypothetical protein